MDYIKWWEWDTVNIAWHVVSLQRMSATCIIIMAIFVIISLSIVGLADNEEMGEPFGVFFSLNKLNKNKNTNKWI